MMKKRIEIIGMIYKSVDYLDFMVSQLKSLHNSVPDWEVGIRIIANDANQRVIDRLKQHNVPYSIYNDPTPNAYYLNRVYRAWNFGGKTSNYENICFVNSDMAFSQHWLYNLIRHHDGINIPCSRLVESGKMLSGLHAISRNYGRHPKQLNIPSWEHYVNIISEDKVLQGGLYMPCIFEKERFIESGMYPEGNVYADGIGTCNGHPTRSGDEYYFVDVLAKRYGMKHITVANSLVYHIQEGEKDYNDV